MVFSSPLFVFAFLPLVLLVYQIVIPRLKNAVLMVFSLLFYAWGEGEMLVILILSIIVNYFTAIYITKSNKKFIKRLVLTVGVIVNVGMLLYYKYANFFVHNYNLTAEEFGLIKINLEKVLLPLGISFFTFQGLSYIIDVYRGQTEVQRNPLDLALYISFFPQLIAGPIVRYHDISDQLKKRIITSDLFISGIQRFIIGLSKKVLIADPLARVDDLLFVNNPNELNGVLAWLGMLTAVIRLYFDFSGYSDMAIGMGRMFGFKFLENFNFPLSVRNMRMFWTHWHISLSNWFKDYIYFPLGGNKKGPLRTYFNLWLIFFLSGLWHGSEWTFIVFGMYHGFFMVLERIGIEKFLKKMPYIFQNMYVWLVFALGIILYRSPDLHFAQVYYSKLFEFQTDISLHEVWIYLQPEFWFLITIGFIFCYPLTSFWRIFICNDLQQGLKGWITYGLYCMLFFLSIAAIAANTYSPFIYFRF